ncbi:hypothetical protein KY348_00805 [Candidatus Woesearchaeota archaeon]|nr:hypothetical protein [Candidatus Woesearchaeota archaeon]
MTKDSDDVRNFFLKWGFPLVFGTAGMMIGLIYLNERKIITNTEPGYIPSPNVRIEAADYDRNGLYETILTYNSKKYLLMKDREGKPIIKEYSLEEKINEK